MILPLVTPSCREAFQEPSTHYTICLFHIHLLFIWIYIYKQSSRRQLDIL